MNNNGSERKWDYVVLALGKTKKETSRNNIQSSNDLKFLYWNRSLQINLRPV